MTVAAQTQVATPSAAVASMTAMRPNLRVVDGGASARNTCQHCALNGLCLPEGLAGKQREEFTALIFQHKRLQTGQPLFHAGEPFTNLYFVKTGSLKSVVLLADGREQVTGFHFAGDVLGVDAISSPSHPSEAVAMEDTQVCAIPFAQLMRMSQRIEHLQVYVQRLLAREVVRDQGLMLLLGRMQADERVAAFLLNVSQRFKARGYSPLEFTRGNRQLPGPYAGNRQPLFFALQEYRFAECRQPAYPHPECRCLAKGDRWQGHRTLNRNFKHRRRYVFSHTGSDRRQRVIDQRSASGDRAGQVVQGEDDGDHGVAHLPAIEPGRIYPADREYHTRALGRADVRAREKGARRDLCGCCKGRSHVRNAARVRRRTL
jgi:CRP/FNR family transcriptional regulator